jgi:hypothetical protein
MLDGNVKLNLDAFKPNGEPILPDANAKTFVRQCGVVVRDAVPITMQEWIQPNNPKTGVKYVEKRLKDALWLQLMEHFILPDSLSERARDKVKEFALHKMATAFQTWKKKLWTEYKARDNKAPEFTGIYEKIRNHWDAFIEYKTSIAAMEKSEKNKLNAGKKKYHHKLGTGGYKAAIPKWDALENRIVAEGITPVTLHWPRRCRNWFFAHGGKLDPATGKIIALASLENASKELLKAIKAAQEGQFHPDRENDELTLALGNPEHGGRTRGVGVVPWYEGFAGWQDSYKSRSRKKKVEADRLSKLEQKYEQQQQEIQELKQQRATPRQVHPASEPTLQKSSAGSTGAPLGHTPVDDIAEKTSCELVIKVKNIPVRVATGYALPNTPGVVWHFNPVPAGFARVAVDSIEPQYEGLELDIPGGEGESTLAEAGRALILWRKDCIVFPHLALRPPAPPSIDVQHEVSQQPEASQRQQSSPPREASHFERDPSASPPNLGTEHDESPYRRSPPREPTPPRRQRSREQGSQKTISSPLRKKAKKKSEPPAKKKLAYEMSDKETDIESAAQVKAFFAPKPLPPKEVIPKEVKEHFREHFVDRPPAWVENMPSDYDRQIRKQRQQRSRPSPRKKSSRSTTSTTGGATRGKTVPQLGEQSKQSISPLKVSTDQLANVYGAKIDLEELDRAGLTLDQLMETEEISGYVEADLAMKYAHGKPLVTSEQCKNLPTAMRKLHEWYMREAKRGQTFLMLKVTKEHYVNACDISVEFSELFQLYHLDSIDKSLISCYCL